MKNILLALSIIGDKVDRTVLWTKDKFCELNVLSPFISRHEKSLGHIKAGLEISTRLIQ